MIGVILAAAFALASPASALATDLFVDKETGTNSGPNNCLNQASPCQTITYALSLAASGDTVKVDDTVFPYVEATLGLISGRSLAGFEFGPHGDEGGGPEAADVDIQPASGFPAIDLGSGVANTISGLRLITAAAGKGISSGGGGTVATITGNTFDTTTGGVGIFLTSGTGTTTVSGNVFKSASTTDDDGGVSFAGPTAIIEDNTFKDFLAPIKIASGSPNSIVRRNQITGVQRLPTPGTGIEVLNSAGATLEDNKISLPIADFSTGISVRTSAGSPTSATLRRNQVYGQRFGITTDDTTSLSLNGDVIGNSTVGGLVATDSAAIAGDGNVNAKNVTVFSPLGTDIQLIDNILTLDASIVGNAIAANAGATCALSNSRGPTSPGSGCTAFSTSDVPSFVNAAANDFHLMPLPANANLIDDSGSTLPAAPDNLDFEGQKRAMDGDGNCTELTDVGADEVMPTALPTAAITSGPAEGSTITTSTTSFTFTNSNTCPGVGFQVALDGAAFSSGSTPANLAGLANGAHTFQVRALDLVPQSGPAVARNFTVAVPTGRRAAALTKCKKKFKKNHNKKTFKKCRRKASKLPV